MAKLKRAIFFNGPPNSGKDRSGILAKHFLQGKMPLGEPIIDVKMLKFAEPLKWASHALLNIPFATPYYEQEFGNEWKNKPNDLFYGKTPRSEYIALSEEFAKVRHGKEIFGKVAARRIALERQANVFIFTDSGFADEFVPVAAQVGLANCHLISVSRPGTSFEGDSRGYIVDELTTRFGTGKINHYKLPNLEDLEQLRLFVHATMGKIFRFPE